MNMRQNFVRNPTMDLLEILEKDTYYNISAMMLAILEHNFKPMIEIYGEAGAFKEIRKINNYSRFLKNLGDPNGFPVGLGKNCKILRPHEHISAFILAKIKKVPFILNNEPTPNFGDTWVEQFSTKESIVMFYPKLLLHVKSLY